MNPQEILTKAIKKAIAGGWTGCYVTHSTTARWVITGTPKLCVDFTTGGNAYFHPNEFIFNHVFAKALWGELQTEDPIYLHTYPAWELHLQQMVIADDQIKYLGEHI